ncbi:hypothetical protein SUGI_0030160 [Cryptomeria japonica]|uniref:exocyst complex component EXO70H1-like n=1 Tax=Cryptomeria japonica TaxID=3369 RepID=UPI002408CB7C|nr:exocyst complex component EXO70H1-like [Cryptomeria japonica]GLJ05998.1 hypothetical protein SUGI_0030160 [Cryptomeria japonica]
MEEKLAAAEILISKWDTNTTGKMLFQSNAEEVRVYMDTVENLQRHLECLSAGGTNVAQLIRAQGLMKLSMARLQNEFHKILLCNSEPIDPDRESSAWSSSRSSTEDSIATDSDDDRSSYSISNCSSADRICEFSMVPSEAVVDLRTIAQGMAKSGYTRECVRIFALTRKSVVDESFYNLGVEIVRLKDVRKMQWKLLDDKIKKWIYAAKISIRILFAQEKRLCADVFEGLDKMRDSSFAEIAKERTESLLAFAEAVATTSRAPERMFRVLDLYEVLTDLMPDIEDTYFQETCRSVHEHAKRILVQLGEAARGILMEFEKAVEKEKSKVPIPGGTVHPLTRYVMNYLCFLSDYKEPLVNIITNPPGEIPKTPPYNKLNDPSGPLSVHLGWTIFLLLTKLDKTSDLYKDVALSYLFLMNNVHYIEQKLNGSELKSILGKGWVRKLSNNVREYAVKYERAAWMKVFSSVTDEEVTANGGVSSVEGLKEKLKEFNSEMEEVKRRHIEWVVADISLREKLRVSITEKLIPSYSSFLRRFRSRFESDTKYIKYAPEEVHDFVLHVFEGNPLTVSSKRSR